MFFIIGDTIFNQKVIECKNVVFILGEPDSEQFILGELENFDLYIERNFPRNIRGM